MASQTRQTFGRHDLLQVAPQAWRRTLAGARDHAHLSREARRLVDQWADRGWPVIVRRDAVGEAGEGIAAGLPLPPSLGKLRLCFRVPADSVAKIAAVSPRAASLSVPADLRPQLQAAAALGAQTGSRPALFGALLWQHLTGLAYVRPGSDIDLLWPAPRSEMLSALLDGIASIDEAGPARLDGEILLSGGAGVNWRELRTERARPDGAVLVKSMAGAELRCAHHLFP